MANVNAVENDSLGQTPPTFTQEQYGQILRLLNKENSVIPAVNQAGMDHSFSISNKFKHWVVDSGATKHITTSLDDLFDIVALEQSDHNHVQLPDGGTASITHTGSYRWDNGDVLANVLVVPDFKYNLISVSQLTRHLHCSVRFFPEFCVFQDLLTGKVKGIGKETGSLYFLLNKDVGDGSNMNAASAKLMHIKTNDDEGMLWHNRLGHPSSTTLKKLVSINDRHINDCVVCPLAKQTRLPFPVSTTRSSSVFELIHIDV